eukprot:TRINITY_DN16190_c0_g1_i1.p1 TRINITY_DN16190_c0_g1~~TRINITY_DN16190_c0_g1_i1.p1  ORF type:complete len:1186 (+),score=464.45 TRINITY_DN16190_c0_g1_i1:123-3680(+)
MQKVKGFGGAVPRPRTKTHVNKKGREEEVQGITQMASLLISHVFAPLWSIGMSNDDLKTCGCLQPVDWQDPAVEEFVSRMDAEEEARDTLTVQFGRMYETLVDNPVLCTVYMVLNIARLEHIEHNAVAEVAPGPSGPPQRAANESREEDIQYRGLLKKQRDRNAPAKLTGERNHGWNDEIFADHASRSLTDMGGEALVKIDEKAKAKATLRDPKLAQTRRDLLHVLLLASCSCHYNFHDDALYHFCSLVCTKMFLIAPAEVLSNLVCGQKGPVYLSKYLRFLMASTGPLVHENTIDQCLPGQIANAAREAQNIHPSALAKDAADDGKKKDGKKDGNSGTSAPTVPGMVNDAWLVIFSALVNLCHSSNRKAGPNICAAFSVALREQLSKISRLQQRISDLEEHKQYDDVSKKSHENRTQSTANTGLMGKVMTTFNPFVHVAGPDDPKEPPRRRLKDRADEKRRLQDALAFYTRPLPSLLSLIRIFLCRVHCYGEDGPRGWGELMSTVRQLQVYPHRVGVLAVEITRAATAAVQCMDALPRYRLSRCIVGGGAMLTLKRERAYLLATTAATRVLSTVYLGHLPRTKAMGDASLHIPMNSSAMCGLRASVEATLDENNWCDEILASASLFLNIMYKVARREEHSPDPDLRDMRHKLGQLPPNVLASYYPKLYRLMTGPQGGGLGRLATFSEGGDPDSLKVSDGLYEKIVSLYLTMVEEAGTHMHDEYEHLHIKSPAFPALNICTDFRLPEVYDGDDASGASSPEELLENIIREERRYYHKETDYWGHETTEKLQPYEIKLLVAGGSSAIREFAQAIARLYASGKRLGRFPVFRVYPLPVGSPNYLCGWMAKNDAVYQQMVAWPLTQAAFHADERDGSTNDLYTTPRSVNKPNGSPQHVKAPEGFESVLLRNALDTYLADADKANKVYLYRCDCYREDGGEATTYAWCQQVELGPGSEVRYAEAMEAADAEFNDAVSIGSARPNRPVPDKSRPRNKSRGSSIGRAHGGYNGVHTAMLMEDVGQSNAPRRLTVCDGMPIPIELQYVEQKSSMLGLHYPDLRQPKEFFTYKLSIRNVGKEGDVGLYPDPTEPTLQMYHLGHPDREKAVRKFGTSSVGAHYTILGTLTVASKDGFRILIDGALHGPFVKVQIGPWLVNHQVDGGMDEAALGLPRHARHVGFDVMSFCPLAQG